jgi:hypothetical protein
VKLVLPLVAALLLCSCGRHNIDNKEAVRKGVVEYLDKRKGQTGLDMNLMNVEVTNVNFDKNEARATVAFRSKDGSAGGGMSMNYVLERKDDKWVVKGRQESGMSPHGGGAIPGATSGEMPAMPLNHPPTQAPPPNPEAK